MTDAVRSPGSGAPPVPRIFLRGSTLEGDTVERGVLLPLGPRADDGVQRLSGGGVAGRRAEAGFVVDRVVFGSPAARLGIEPGFRITAVEVPSERPDTEWMFLPVPGRIGWVVVRQRRRLAAAPV